MIITIVRFPGSVIDSLEETVSVFAESAGRYLDVPGLIGKAYLHADDNTVGAIYWWTNRADAEAKFNPGWVAGVTKKYGSAPIVEFCDAPLVVDNIAGTIRTEPPHCRNSHEA